MIRRGWQLSDLRMEFGAPRNLTRANALVGVPSVGCSNQAYGRVGISTCAAVDGHGRHT